MTEYTISTVDEFVNFAGTGGTADERNTVYVTADLDFAGASWNAVTNNQASPGWYIDWDFCGHTIKNIVVDDTDNEWALFRSSYGDISNLTVSNLQIKAKGISLIREMNSNYKESARIKMIKNVLIDETNVFETTYFYGFEYRYTAINLCHVHFRCTVKADTVQIPYYFAPKKTLNYHCYCCSSACKIINPQTVRCFGTSNSYGVVRNFKTYTHNLFTTDDDYASETLYYYAFYGAADNYNYFCHCTDMGLTSDYFSSTTVHAYIGDYGNYFCYTTWDLKYTTSDMTDTIANFSVAFEVSLNIRGALLGFEGTGFEGDGDNTYNIPETGSWGTAATFSPCCMLPGTVSASGIPIKLPSRSASATSSITATATVSVYNNTSESTYVDTVFTWDINPGDEARTEYISANTIYEMPYDFEDYDGYAAWSETKYGYIKVSTTNCNVLRHSDDTFAIDGIWARANTTRLVGTYTYTITGGTRVPWKLSASGEFDYLNAPDPIWVIDSFGSTDTDNLYDKIWGIGQLPFLADADKLDSTDLPDRAGFGRWDNMLYKNRAKAYFFEIAMNLAYRAGKK